MGCRRYNDYERARRYRSYYNNAEHAYADGFDKGCEASARAALEIALSSKNHYNGHCNGYNDDLNILELQYDGYDGYDDHCDGRRRYYRDYGCDC